MEGILNFIEFLSPAAIIRRNAPEISKKDIYGKDDTKAMRIVYREEGVSEVIGTILVLAITVVLFTTVFIYVQHIPSAQKSAQISIIPNFLITDGNLNITLNDKSGTPLDVNNTYLSVVIGGSVYSATLAALSKQLNSGLTISNGYFVPGGTLWWNSSGRDITINPNTTYGALIFSKQYNQIMWQSQNYFTSFANSFGIISAYSSPTPIVPSQYFDVFVQVYSTSNAVSVYGNFSSLNGSKSLDNMSFQLLSGQGDIKTYYTTLLAPSSIPPSATANITAVSLGQKRFDNLSLSSSTGVNPILSIPANGVTFQNSEPLHGSNDVVTVIVRNNGSVGASFVLTVKDLYPSGSSQYIESNYANGVNTTFEVGAYSSSSIEFVWINVGGTSPTSGRNILNFSLFDIVGVNGIKEPNLTPARDVYVYIIPKILLVNEEGVPIGSSQDVYDYYYTAFEYNNYQPTSISVSPNEQVSLSGYDVIVWFTGDSTQGITSNQLSTLEDFYSSGGKLLIISGASATYGTSGTSLSVPNTQNVTFNSKPLGFDKFNATAVNYSNMNQNFEANFGGISLLSSNSKPFIYMSTNGNNNYTIGYSSTNSEQGRSVVVGFEMARLELYQLDFAIDKIMLWLSNVTVGSGNQLVLSDIHFSTRAPLFDQTVTISFIITNLSPISFNDVTLEVLINNQIYKFIEGITVNGSGNFTMVKVNWTASPPGKTIVTGIVDPFHQIQQVNYALDVASSLVNTTVMVRFSTLILHDGGSGTWSTVALNNSLKDLGVSFTSLGYTKNGKLTVGNFSTYLTEFNVIFVYSGSSPYVNSTLYNALTNYYMNKLKMPNVPYSLIFLGNDTESLMEDPSHNLANFFNINFQSSSYSSSSKGSVTSYYLYGINYTSPQGFGYFGNNVTNGYGIVINVTSSENILYNVSAASNSLALFHHSWLSTPDPVSAGAAILFNYQDSGFEVGVLPFGFSDISGLIQPHTSAYRPQSGAKDAKDLLMLNILGSTGYTVDSPVPYVMASTISFSSPVMMINRYYVVSADINNLGNASTAAVVDAFDGSGLFSSQTVTLAPLSMTPVQFIWDPQYAALPSNPRDIRIIVTATSVATPSEFSFAKEGIAETPVYVFYDNMSTGNNWVSHATVWAYTGVNFDGTSSLYSSEPYSTEGIIAANIQQNPMGAYVYNGGSTLFSYISSKYWGFIPNSVSGGYAIGTSSAFVGYRFNSEYNKWTDSPNAWNNTFGYASIATSNLNLNGAQYAYLEFDAIYKLALGGEGVAVFISSSGSSTWNWISPLQGYPGNVNYLPLIYTAYDTTSDPGFTQNKNWNFPTNSGDLLPAFTTVSGGENFGWQQYTFNISAYTGDSSVSVRFVLILNGENTGSGYNTGIYGNDFFYMDNVKVIENSTVKGAGATQGDLWTREQSSSGIWFYNSLIIYPTEVDSVVSVPISLSNLVNATLSFQTMYSIYATFANAVDPTDVPNGFRLYVGFLGSNGAIIWNQLDTRWAGEAGLFDGQWFYAQSLYSVYYSNVYAFHQNGNTISLTGYIGLTIFLKFEVNGDTLSLQNNPTDSPPVSENGIASPSSATNNWADFTNVIITGNSYADLISVNSIWY